MVDTYTMPVDGWVCFHCGVRFLSPGAASNHFGEAPWRTAACKIKAGEEKGLLMALRKEEAITDQLRNRIAELETANICKGVS